MSGMSTAPAPAPDPGFATLRGLHKDGLEALKQQCPDLRTKIAQFGADGNIDPSLASFLGEGITYLEQLQHVLPPGESASRQLHVVDLRSAELQPGRIGNGILPLDEIDLKSVVGFEAGDIENTRLTWHGQSKRGKKHKKEKKSKKDRPDKKRRR